MKRKYLLVLLGGIFLRLLLAFSSFHPDVQAFVLGGQVVGSGHILNLYDYIGSLPASTLIAHYFPADLFIYPPLIYLYEGIFNVIFGSIFGSSVIGNFLVVNTNTFGNLLFNWHMLLTKLPYLLFDIPAAFLLAGLFTKPREKFLAFTLWMFNPVDLYATYMMGQFDVIATFFVIWSLYLTLKNKLYWAALVLGVGVAFKLYPLYLIIPLAFLRRDFLGKVKVALLSLLPYVITIAPFLPSHGFRSSALAAGQTFKSFYAQIPVSGGEALLLFPITLLFFYLVFYYVANKSEDLWKKYFIVLLLFYVFTHIHPQWFLWLTPFLIIDLVSSGFKHWLPSLAALFSFFGLLFFFDPSLTVGIFAPLWPSLHDLPPLWQIFHINVDYNFSRSLLQSLFAAAALYYLYRYFPRRSEG